MALIGHEPTPAPPLPPWEMYNLAELEECLPNQQSQFLKQNEELLKLLDSLHGQEHDELVPKEDEILCAEDQFLPLRFIKGSFILKQKRIFSLIFICDKLGMLIITAIHIHLVTKWPTK